jgi:hypothetical protein
MAFRADNAGKNDEKPAQMAQKQPVLAGCGPIVTLWQQWG